MQRENKEDGLQNICGWLIAIGPNRALPGPGQRPMQRHPCLNAAPSCLMACRRHWLLLLSSGDFGLVSTGKKLCLTKISESREIYAAFSRGDVPTIMQHISDDLQGFGIVSEGRLVPLAHEDFEKTRDRSKVFPSPRHSQDTTRLEPRDFAAGGDYVYCTVSLGVTYKRNHKKLTIDNVMHRFRVQEREGRRVARDRGYRTDECRIQRGSQSSNQNGCFAPP